MRRSRCGQQVFTTLWFVLPVLLLLLVGLASAACRPKDEAAEPPAEQSSAASPEPAPAPTVAEITFAGFMPPKWDPKEGKVGPGDTVVWKIGNGSHSLKFDPEPCAIAQARMTFDPPLINCVSEVKGQTDEVIVKATVNQALEADLPFRCGVHPSMTGALKPK